MNRHPIVALSTRHALLVAFAVLALGVSAALASSARAELGLVPGSLDADVYDADGVTPDTRAGATPTFVKTTFEFQRLATNYPDQNAKTIEVDLPAGLVGNVQAIPTCDRVVYGSTTFGDPACPPQSQVGQIRLVLRGTGTNVTSNRVPVYNLEPRDGDLAEFAFQVVTTQIHIFARLNPDGTVTATIPEINEQLPLLRSELTLWGTPAAALHTPERKRACGGTEAAPDTTCSGGNVASGITPKPFWRTPTYCGPPLTTTLRAESWQNLGAFITASDTTASGPTGCDQLQFNPTINVEPDSTVPDSPTGLNVDVNMPTDFVNPNGRTTAHLRDAKVVLPEGMTISPSAADGLASCSDAEAKFGSGEPMACSPASKVGTLSAETPVLPGEIGGSIFVGQQRSDDPESGEMFRIFLELEKQERGVRIKLEGKVRANAHTGRLEATFDDNPQLPVSRISLHFKGGPRAPLATPPTCGTKTVTSELTSWAGHVVTPSDSFTVDCPGQAGFAPSFVAGSVNPTGGRFSPFAARIGRSDGQQFLSGVSVDLPEGLLAKVRGVPLCGSVAAEIGGCPAGSQVGTATVAAGPGGNPFRLQGDVFLTEGYKGAPYGLAVHVLVKAGPFDLGWVRVRQALYVDPVTAKVSAVSDPLPQIVKGVPVRLRSVNVDVDQPGFTINPTSCSEKQIGATLTSIDGAVHRTSSRFQVGDCASLRFDPKLAMRLIGTGRTKTGGHPGLKAVLTQKEGQANIASAKVALPKSIVLDPNNSTDPKLLCGYDAGLKADCPASSVIGTATANTPLLNRPVTGAVHLVQGIRFGPSGNRIRTTPTLLVKLRGEIAIDLRAKTTVKGGRLVTTFGDVPDAAVSKFSLSVNGGAKGILVVTRTAKAKIDVCKSKQIAAVATDGQNGKRHDFDTRIKTPCPAKKSKGSGRKAGRA